MSQQFDNVDRQRGRLFGLGGILIAALCATLLLVSSNGDTTGIALERRWPTLVGLAGLVTLFVLFAQYQHRKLAAMESRLRELAVREATLQARFSELSFLFDTSTQLQLRLDLHGMLDLAAQRLLPCLDAHQSSIMLFDESSGMLIVQATAGVDSGLVQNASAKPGDGVAGHVFATGETLNLSPELMRQRFADHVKQSRQISAGLCVPMRFRGAPIGVVNVSRTTGEPFSDLHVRMLEAFAEHCAATVVKTHHHHDLLRQVQRAAA